ncbi:MAG: M28 family peptidase [Haliscomenobacter sp.]|nr:M28 family peptidase [Haliscomenobacter sp.]MBK8878905.1 M28 family peptidase [Haliscomenobacter sp.]
MKKPALTMALLCLVFFSGLKAQPEAALSRETVEGQLRFLASDALQGRRTGEPGNLIAASFIAALFQTYGLEKAPGLNAYFQPIQFEQGIPPQRATLKVGATEYVFKEDFVLMAGDPIQMEKADAVFAGYGWVDPATSHDDYKGLDIKGKVVFVLSGRPDQSDPRAGFAAMGMKQKLASERGAAALIELYRLPFPWNFFRRYVGGESLQLPKPDSDHPSSMVYGWLKEKEGAPPIPEVLKGKQAKVALFSEGYQRRQVPSQNVIGIIPGTDPVLKKEYVLLTAHYDHVGMGRLGGGATTPADSIFNGARDNAMGTVALLAAANVLSKERPKRSVILLAVTGEELGLLGSSYYAENPLIPLKDVIFNLNTDGAGYNDVGIISVIGWGRTGTDDLISQAAVNEGLKPFPDPAPEQGLFDRSDNVAFAAKGVPCVTVSPGFTRFDEAINKYYHQVTDEAESVDMEYLLKYSNVFTSIARLIANHSEKPQWKSGDKYEQAGKALYQERD